VPGVVFLIVVNVVPNYPVMFSSDFDFSASF